MEVSAMRMLRTIVAVTFSPMMLVTVVPTVRAQPAADHLKCFKVNDPQAKTSYTADLDVIAGTAGGISEPGCVPPTHRNSERRRGPLPSCALSPLLDTLVVAVGMSRATLMGGLATGKSPHTEGDAV